jgi:hypothetical protein
MFRDSRLKARIDSFTEDNFAILDISGLKIEWPLEKIPDGTGIGDWLYLEAYTSDQIKQKDKRNAQALLDEILGGYNSQR